jgi:hypothetical protein
MKWIYVKRFLIVIGIIFILIYGLATANIDNPTILADKDENIEWLSFEKDRV